MILPLAYYGNPVLREKGASVEAVTSEIDQLVEDMFETMEGFRGIGLAAHQVGKPIQLTVIDIRTAEDRPSTLELGGKEADPHSIMPIVLINPSITPLNDPIQGPEGCLSFPEIFGEISRPDKVRVKALDRHGKPIEFVCSGLLSRAIQHEADHLHGVLFIDRMDRATKSGLREELELLQDKTKSAIANDSAS
jgi:peptide deformylase|tara:strand:+ start:628 stop:1206 length:579 start_codon:yes stop_codon:yes gene_type:complete